MSSKYDELLNQLLSYVESLKHLPEQGTPEHHAKRKLTIGASEIHALIPETSSNRAKCELVCSKLNLRQFCGSEFTNWGNIFEECVRLFIRKYFGIQTFETGSIDGLKYQSASPDDLAVIMMPKKFKCGKSLNSKILTAMKLRNVDLTEAKLTLLEYKSPARRQLNGTVLPKYLSQVKVGINTTGFDVGLFVESTFRRCTLNQLNSPKGYRNSVFQNSEIFNDPKAYGIIGVYTEWDIWDQSQRDSELKNLKRHYMEDYCGFNNIEMTDDVVESFEEDLIDFGDVSNTQFNLMMQLVMDKQLFIKHYIFDFTEPNSVEKYINQFEMEFYDKNIIGVIPWKLFEIDFMAIENTLDYTKNVHDDIVLTMEMVENLKLLPREDQITHLEKKFTKRTLTSVMNQKK